MEKAKFTVRPRLISLLSNQYKSSEHALKELVDNAWDADAENVHITIPTELFTDETIIISDDGIGMTYKQLREDYLNIAYDRRLYKGEVTLKKGRKIRGHKGIGKFAGLVTASIMEVVTTANNQTSRLTLNKNDLYDFENDIEQIEFNVTTMQSELNNGTTIKLLGLNQGLNFPSIERFRDILLFEFGRQSDFNIYINKEKITYEDIQGVKKKIKYKLIEAGDITGSIIISENRKPLKNPGVIIRIGGRAIGEPTFFGLEKEEGIPKKILNRIWGEVEANDLINVVNSGWDAISENSKGYSELQEYMKQLLNNEIKKRFKDETNQLQKEILYEFKSKIEKLPLPRQEIVKKSINRVLSRFYGDSEEKIKIMVSLLIKAFEEDEYWEVMAKIEEASVKDINSLAEALNIFGMWELSNVAKQANKRIEFIKYLNKMLVNPNTLEKEMHTALEKNLWIFGIKYSLVSSNISLNTIIAEYCEKKYTGTRAKKRPDLLLAQDINRNILLVEFKKPSKTITRDDEAQAIKYRDDLHQYFPNSAIEIIVIGKDVDSNISNIYRQESIQLSSYYEVISSAESQLQWLLENL
ncbi:Shedu anti-phage system protein SduA domain-containing protein [Paenibacillus chitinolyticus]|uniref:Shedu anti-phage system protein SduA domain-containing protein n=1 Tax=Paenibacillus chitinolyticus TaxID=79263 RepID=UPI0036DAB671